MMDENETRWLESAVKESENERLKRISTENDNYKMAMGMSNREQNLVQLQLELKEDLEKLYHDLAAHEIKIDQEGNEVWVDNSDDRMRVFSDLGVKALMNIISFYVNRNTLLSCYDNTTIMWKVRDFGIELADLIYSRYESFFYYPSPEDLFEQLSPLIKKENAGIGDHEIYSKCIEWSENELKQKIKHYPIIVMNLVNFVHTTYLRALSGGERSSMRKTMHITQNVEPYNSYPQGNPQFKMSKPSTWGAK